MDPENQPQSGTAQPDSTFRLVLAYDGTDYFGWQVQPGLRTVQGVLAETVRQVTGETVLPQGSGRTDTGVHAEGQVVSLVLRANIPADRLHRALNRRLPSAIRVVSLAPAADGFHARSGVSYKTYEYRIFQRRLPGLADERICPPHAARYAWDCRWPLEVEPMQQAAWHLLGTHDFTSFAASDPDRAHRLAAAGEPLDNVRRIDRAAWHHGEGLLVFRVTGTGFLHHMVRNIVGTCVEAGAGRIAPDSIPGILEALDRRRAGPTAPPQGLHLVEVVYADQRAPQVDAETELARA